MMVELRGAIIRSADAVTTCEVDPKAWMPEMWTIGTRIVATLDTMLAQFFDNKGGKTAKLYNTSDFYLLRCGGYALMIFPSAFRWPVMAFICTIIAPMSFHIFLVKLFFQLS